MRLLILIALVVPLPLACSYESPSRLRGESPDPPTSNSDANSNDGLDSSIVDSGIPVTDSNIGDAEPIVDAAPEARAPISCTGLTYCDDFEAYSGAIATGTTVGPWNATVEGVGTEMTIDTTRAYSGEKALRVKIPAGTAPPARQGILRRTSTGPLIAGNNMYGRAMVFYSNGSGYNLPLGAPSWFFSAGGPAGDAGTMQMDLGGGGEKLRLNYRPPTPAPEVLSTAGGTLTAGTWHCIQWQYNGAADSGKVWLDGAVVVDVPASTWSLASPWNAFSFGFRHFQTLAAGVDVFYDDFALDEAMVPCP